MKYRLEFDGRIISGSFNLPASKSISNRLLIIDALSKNGLKLNNLSTSTDTQELIQVLSNLTEYIHTGNGGTSTRFVVAMLSTIPGIWTVGASESMEKRPISGLVNALIDLGVEISYLNKENHLPIRINGGNITKDRVAVSASISSQYISALLLIAPVLPKGLTISLEEKIVSKPYIEMTLSILDLLGVKYKWIKNSIVVSPSPLNRMSFLIENDWSAASYWYSIAALSENTHIELLGLNAKSIQGDAEIATIFKQLGVSTKYKKGGVLLESANTKPKHLNIDFLNTPDIAPTVITTATALGITGTYGGLDTLEKKESKRITGLINELRKIGASIDNSSHNTLKINKVRKIRRPVSIETYGDHRMAMAFAPLAIVLPYIEISNPKVVEKSYPEFWDELKKTGIQIEEVSEH